MPSGKPKLPLGESWGGEGEDDSLERSPQGEEGEPLAPKPTPGASRSNNRSPEPEFVMPSLDASWADSSSSKRFRKGPRYAEREARRRSTRQGANDGSPVKDRRAKEAATHKTFTAAVSHFGSSSAPKEDSSNSSHDTLGVFLEHCGIMASWIRDVVGGALRVLKTPLSYVLAVYLLLGLGIVVRNLATNTMYASLSPVCRLPGVSLLNLPFCPVYQVDTRNGPPPAVEFDQLMTVQAQFEEVLEESAGSVSLPMDMKRGEASIRDLRQLVRYSQLHSK
jgi:hypothetical protein